MTVRRADQTNVEVSSESFGCRDKKGRVIGAKIWQYISTFEAWEPNDYEFGWAMEPGVYFSWRGHGTRDGKCYGPGSKEMCCKTEEERSKQVAKYLKEARKRAAKK